MRPFFYEPRFVAACGDSRVAQVGMRALEG
jgi:hypothetical protein